ncbi:autotransporter assembly complex protein TamA [Aristophania vespae]|uniref:autotransporter assembly complex protein TamA n=1 Tax=Aristophania vespae TaxID=2697033 RepID=UPI00235198AC|nr:BamA/TamA family outer membrane protein [Aristophania vespae]UMM63289.1 Outer membrane protein assembly factor BamA [Aristophania vespae]
MKPVRTLSLCLTLVISHFLGVQQAFSETATSQEKEQSLAYEINIKKTADSNVDSALQAASQLVALQKTHHIGPYALAGRIRSDYGRLEGGLRSEGFYGGSVEIKVFVLDQEYDGRDPALAGILSQLPEGKTVKITASATLASRYHVGAIELLSAHDEAHRVDLKAIPLTSEEKKAFGVKIGDKAIAKNILASQTRLEDYLHEEGYGLASVSRPKAILNHDRHEITVRTYVNKGPKLVVGPFHFKGLKHVKQDYVARRIHLHEGELYKPSSIENSRLDLGSTGLFSAIQIENAPPVISISPDKSEVENVSQAMPLNFSFTEGKRHRVAGEVGFSTDLGGRLGASWLHRNLLGRGEQLKISALATGLGGSAQQGLGYDGYVDFSKPDFLDRGRVLNLRAEGVRQLLYSYHQTALILRGGFSQPINDEWKLNGAISLEQENIKQFGKSRNYFIASLPLGVDYDGTGRTSPIDPATHGVKISISVTPSESLEHQTSFFAILNGQISTYFDIHNLGLTRPGRSIIALRGIVGSIQGATTWDIPPDQRLYAGGQSTVRGFRYQGVGPQFRNSKYAIGGSSMDAATIEYRQRLFKSFGTALFVDAGQVGKGSMPGHGKLRIGYGAGVRYFTPIGPVRLDIALPYKRPPRGDKWELYIGLGESF